MGNKKLAQRHYRAVLVGAPRHGTEEKIDAPLQVFGVSWGLIDLWAEAVLKAYPIAKFPDVRVEVYEQIETLVVVRKSKVEKKAPSKPLNKAAGASI
jgi:hypothetical protein